MLQITAELLSSLEDGKIFGVTFIKRTDGSPRTMSCRRGASVNIQGVGQSFDPAEHSLLTVFSCNDEGYRNIPLDSITELKHHGRVLRA